MLGYTPVRKAIASPRLEPDLQTWLKAKGIEHRHIHTKTELRCLLRLLSPVREKVKDKENMDKLTKMLDKPLRGLSHEQLFESFSLF